MAALHRKVHSTEELLADREHTLNVKLTQQKLESEQREEVLRRQLEETSRNMRHSSSTGKASLESQVKNNVYKYSMLSVVRECNG